MSALSHDPQQSITPERVQAWLSVAKKKRLELHLLAAEPSNSRQRYEAFMNMSDLLQEAFEEVRVISASLREGSQVVREQAVDLRGYATQLLDQCAKSMEQMSQFVPRPEEVQKTDSRLLDICKGDTRPREQ